MSTKSAIKDAGTAAIEHLIQQFMPQLMGKLETLERLMTKLDAKVDHVEAKLNDRIVQVENKLNERINDVQRKFELDIHALAERTQTGFDQTRDTINELGQRISRLDGLVSAYVDMSRNQMTLPERVARLETIRDERYLASKRTPKRIVAGGRK